MHRVPQPSSNEMSHINTDTCQGHDIGKTMLHVVEVNKIKFKSGIQIFGLMPITFQRGEGLNHTWRNGRMINDYKRNIWFAQMLFTSHTEMDV